MQNRTLMVLSIPALHHSAYPSSCSILIRHCLTVSAVLQAANAAV